VRRITNDTAQAPAAANAHVDGSGIPVTALICAL
jgi:hypothetical protein